MHTRNFSEAAKIKIERRAIVRSVFELAGSKEFLINVQRAAHEIYSTFVAPASPRNPTAVNFFCPARGRADRAVNYITANNYCSSLSRKCAELRVATKAFRHSRDSPLFVRGNDISRAAFRFSRTPIRNDRRLGEAGAREKGRKTSPDKIVDFSARAKLGV